jgi:hypothetical protein
MAVDCNNLPKIDKNTPLNIVGEVIGCLKKEIAGLSGPLNNASSAAGSFVTEIGKGKMLVDGIAQSFASVYTEIYKFGKSLDAQYRLGEKLAKAFKQTSVNIGIGYQNQKILGDEFNKSVMLVQRLGGDIDDVNTIYSKFADQSGRVRILDDEEVQRIFAIEQATGLMGDSATALAERFDLIGIGSEQFAENINQIVKDSQKLGLNSSKVVKVLSDNFENMQRMSFRGGVKAMTEMSKLAVKMRMDVSDMLGMADRFYEPEAAIEAAANLQLLGGEMASAFGDPMQMMFDARNAPEEFARKVGEATKGMVQFNEETGQFDMVAENRQRLIGMADALGINKERLIDTAFQMNKMQRIKMDVGGNLFDEDTMDKISSLAKFDKTSGQWKVDISGQAVPVEDLNTDQIEQALATPSTEEDAIMQTAKGVMTTNETLQSILNATQTGIVIKTDVYGKVEDQLKSPMIELQTATQAVADNLINEAKNALKLTGIDSLGKDLGDMIKSGMITNIQSIKSIAANNINTLTIKNWTKKQSQQGGAASVRKPLNQQPAAAAPRKKAYDLYSGPGDDNRVLTGSFGSFQLDNRDLIAAGDPKKLLSSVISNQKLDSRDLIAAGDPKKLLSSVNSNQKLDSRDLIAAGDSKKLLSSVNSNQKLDVSGTINFGNINISMDGSSETISFTEQDKKEMMESVKYQIIAGVNAMIGDGKRPGKDALVGT